MKYRQLCLLSACLIGFQHLTYAETRYVTDELQLALHEQINSKGQLLERLGSGTELELLEESGLYARVRTPSGVEGWTKAGFLIKEKPARAQLEDLKTENQKLQEELASVRSKLSDAEADLSETQTAAEPVVAEEPEESDRIEQVVAALDRVQQENESYRRQLSGIEHSIPLNWGLIGAGMTFGLGLFAGFRMFDYLSRKRHGGIRIY
ncbi:MAG: TIGR04211 family SH3 domain-containing protein [Candidatus Thiodiazotropha sp.]